MILAFALVAFDIGKPLGYLVITLCYVDLKTTIVFICMCVYEYSCM